MYAGPFSAARPRARLLAAAAAIALIAAATPALSQGAPAEAGERTFEAAGFARFAPGTAYDMLIQVPGFSIRQASVERGLGQATGNVLLNGQRIYQHYGRRLRPDPPHTPKKLLPLRECV